MSKSGPTPQFIASLNAALEYFKRLEATGDIAQLDRERRNIDLVIELGLSRPETHIAAIEAIIGAFQLLYARGYWREGMKTFEKAIEICPDERPDLKVDLLGKLGELQRINGLLTSAVATHESELVLAGELNNPLLTGRAHTHLAHIYREMKQFKKTEAHGRAALTELDQVGEVGLPYNALALNALGRIARRQGNYDQARSYLSQSVVILRQLNNKFLLAEGLHDMSRVYQEMRQFDKALQCNQEAGQLLAGTERVMVRITLQIQMGVIYFNQHQYALAESMFRAVDLDYLRQTGNLEQEARVLTNTGNAVLYQQRYEEAAQLLRRAVIILRLLEDKLNLANTIGSLGEALAGQGKYDQAREQFQEALTLLAPYADLTRGQRLTAFFTNELTKIEA